MPLPPTTKLGLQKPLGPEAQDIDVLNGNADIIDKVVGGYLVNNGVTPPDSDLYPGCIVRENTSGIVWMAQPNGTGGFNKKPISYPWAIRVDNDAVLNTGIANDRTYRIALINRIRSTTNGNSALKTLGTNNCSVVLPCTGNYVINYKVLYSQEAVTTVSTDTRAVTLWRKTLNSYDGIGVESIQSCGSMPAGERYGPKGSWFVQLSEGEEIRVGQWQNSGSTTDIAMVMLEIILITPYPSWNM